MMTIITFFSSFFLLANSSPCDGFNIADQKRCLEIENIEDANKVVLAQCQGFVNAPSGRIECIRLSTKKFESFAAGSCRGFSHIDIVNRCYRSLADRSFVEKAFKKCTGMGSIDTMERCFNAIANKRFQKGALNICDRINHLDPFLSCLEVIHEQNYSDVILDGCGTKRFPEFVNCLRENSSKISNIDAGAETQR